MLQSPNLQEIVNWAKNPEFFWSDSRCRTSLYVTFRKIPKVCWFESFFWFAFLRSRFWCIHKIHKTKHLFPHCKIQLLPMFGDVFRDREFAPRNLSSQKLSSYETGSIRVHVLVENSGQS